MKAVKKSLAVLLAAALLAGIFPLGVMAAEETDPAPVPEITEIGAYIGDDYVLAVPVEQKGEDHAELMSLLPLESRDYRLDLTGYFDEELKNASLQTLVEGLNGGKEPEGDATKYVVWAKWYYYDEDGNLVDQNDDYQLLGETVDLSFGSSSYGNNYSYTIELIVGTCDQLNPSNIRYRVNAYTGGMRDLLSFHAATLDGKDITIYQDEIYYDTGEHSNDGHCYYQIGAKASEYPQGKIKLSFGFGGAAWEARGFDVTVYEGYYQTADQLPSEGSGKNITEKIWKNGAAEAEGYQAEYSWRNKPEFTLVLTGADNTKHVLPFGVYIYADGIDVYCHQLYKKESAGYYNSVASNSHYNNENSVEYMDVTLRAGNSLTGTYYVRLFVSDPEGSYDEIASVRAAYVGKLTQAQVDAKTPGGEDDVKDYLIFSSNNYSSDGYVQGYLDGGYAVDFSKYRSGIVFTVLDREGEIHYVGVRLVGVSPSVPITNQVQDPLSADIYLRVTGANAGSGNIRSYTMPYQDDSYYYNGYQTIFLLNNDTGAVTDEKITPTFYTGDGVKIFSNGTPGDTSTAGLEQISGETAINFLSGEGLRYTISATDKNYWVTFVTQQAKPTLFVNGTNDVANYQEDPSNPGEENKIPARVVYLTEPYNYHHDIFFANLGAETLGGLSVTLTGPDGTGEAVGVELDPYWTIGETKTLAGFTTTYSPANIGKIRLQPQRDETTGEMIASRIDGLLTIRAGSGDDRQEVKIRLVGVAGEFKITTKKLWDGIKHVSYSSLLQTNYMTGGNASITFKLTSGQLPRGLSLLQNGEIYGIPTTPGTYTFTISATCEETILGQKKTWTDSATYTVEIADSNDSAAVWNYEASIFGDEAYKILIAIPNEDNEDNIGEGATKGENSWENETMVLHSDGDYSTFIDKVFLDGRQLTPGVDYTSEAGSTRLVIKTQTLTNTTRGTHTLSVESRVGDKDTGTLHRAAQTYNLSTRGNAPSRPTGGSGSSVQSYGLVALPATNGTVKLSTDRTTSGAKVTIAVAPDAGYLLDTIKASDGNGVEITLTKGEDGIYTFTMPSSAVTVAATFKPQASDELGSRRFLDVPSEAWYAPAVDYVAQAGLMVGTDETTFAPNLQISQPMVVTILARMADVDLSGNRNDVTDTGVEPGQWYTAAAVWAWRSGIVGEGTYAAQPPLTRGDLAVMLVRYLNCLGITYTTPDEVAAFADSSDMTTEQLSAFQRLYDIGILKGVGGNYMAPQRSTTRAEMAIITQRLSTYLADK